MPARGSTTDCTAEEEDGASGTVRGSPQKASGEERRGWRWGGGEGEGEGRCPGETCSCKCVITAQAGEGGGEEGRRLGGGRSMKEGKKKEKEVGGIEKPAHVMPKVNWGI